MNVSQLAVYQLPSDVHTLQKRSTVPFYNRRRASQKRNTESTAEAASGYSHHTKPREKRTTNTTTNCAHTTRCTSWTTTITVTATCCESDQSTSTAWAAHNTTYIDAPLTCMPTPSPSSQSSAAHFSDPDCPCKNKLPPASERTNSASEHNLERRVGADWNRVAYYTSTAPAQATGLSFLANLGDPQKSGTFD
jgi:hypothetical protein